MNGEDFKYLFVDEAKDLPVMVDTWEHDKPIEVGKGDPMHSKSIGKKVIGIGGGNLSLAAALSLLSANAEIRIVDELPVNRGPNLCIEDLKPIPNLYPLSNDHIGNRATRRKAMHKKKRK